MNYQTRPDPEQLPRMEWAWPVDQAGVPVTDPDACTVTPMDLAENLNDHLSVFTGDFRIDPDNVYEWPFSAIYGPGNDLGSEQRYLVMFADDAEQKRLTVPRVCAWCSRHAEHIIGVDSGNAAAYCCECYAENRDYDPDLPACTHTWTPSNKPYDKRA